MKTALGAPRVALCGGIFHDCRGSFLGCFTYPLGISSSLEAELMGAMHVVEISKSKSGLHYGSSVTHPLLFWLSKILPLCLGA
ncbi:hypothetical protein JHK86_027691 [Glycine max]|nr:hypothetical protein JHK86_027691 [Glycine max]